MWEEGDSLISLELRHPLARARGSDVGPAHCVSQVRTKTNVSPLFNSPTCETVRIMSTVTRTGHLVGYARVSTGHQTLNGQHDAFKAAGVDRIFDDIMSGTHADRPGLAAALDYVREGDTPSCQPSIDWAAPLSTRSTPSTHPASVASTSAPSGKASIPRRPPAAWSLACSRRSQNSSES